MTKATPAPEARRAALAAVQASARRLRRAALASLINRDPIRLERLTLAAGPISVHAGKERIDAAGLDALLALANAADVDGALLALFSGAAVNPTEGRAALHWALRSAEADLGNRLGAARAAETLAGLDQAMGFASDVRAGSIRTPDGDAFRTVVHLGIGGSDFGPRLIADAFADRANGPQVRFAANIDPTDIGQALAGVDPKTAMIVLVSKSFSTQETLTNYAVAEGWMKAAGVDAGPRSVAITSKPAKAAERLGGAPLAVFDLPETIGGRYSLFSASSVSNALALGPDVLAEMRAGAHAMDEIVRTAAPQGNPALLLAALDVWRRAGLGMTSRAVLAYSHRLRALPAYLQQLEMESNGKGVGIDGVALPAPAAPVLWGGEGTIGQHSYHQMLHQGVDAVATEFILAKSGDGDASMRRALLAHGVAQAETLMRGLTKAQARAALLKAGASEAEADRLAPHKAMPGGRPSVTLLLEDDSPRTLGALIALYEHRTYLSGVLMGLNPFDQWGVELGKVNAAKVERELASRRPAAAAHDAATRALIDALKA